MEFRLEPGLLGAVVAMNLRQLDGHLARARRTVGTDDPDMGKEFQDLFTLSVLRDAMNQVSYVTGHLLALRDDTNVGPGKGDFGALARAGLLEPGLAAELAASVVRLDEAALARPIRPVEDAPAILRALEEFRALFAASPSPSPAASPEALVDVDEDDLDTDER